jgi:hypothetical protein
LGSLFHLSPQFLMEKMMVQAANRALPKLAKLLQERAAAAETEAERHKCLELASMAERSSFETKRFPRQQHDALLCVRTEGGGLQYYSLFIQTRMPKYVQHWMKPQVRTRLPGGDILGAGLVCGATFGSAFHDSGVSRITWRFLCMSWHVSSSDMEPPWPLPRRKRPTSSCSAA